MLLTGRHALVTGAAQGIGEATARALVAFGADVALCDRRGAQLDEVAGSLSEQGARVLTAPIDVRDEAEVGGFVERIGSEWGRLDLLVNNAGGGFWAPFTEVSAKGRAVLVAENFSQVADVTTRAVGLMHDGGAIVNITSVEAHRAGPGFAVYSAMKAAVANLTKTLALELAPRRIRVNCVAPDVIPTPGDESLVDAAGGLATRGEWAMQPWPEEGHPDDVAAAVVWLCSPMSRFVTGTTVHVDGGTSAASGWKRRLADDRWVL